MDALIPSLRPTLRALMRAPAYALAACLTLALGMAAALGAFAPAWELLGIPFDFRDPGRIVSLSGEGAERASFLRPFSAPDFEDLQRELKSVQGLTACRDAWPHMETPEGPKGVRTALVSPGFFQVLGMPLLMGRDFEPGEAEGSGTKVIVLRHEFWRSLFGGDPRILGKPWCWTTFPIRSWTFWHLSGACPFFWMTPSASNPWSHVMGTGREAGPAAGSSGAWPRAPACPSSRPSWTAWPLAWDLLDPKGTFPGASGPGAS